jgi:hypothetical protein
MLVHQSFKIDATIDKFAFLIKNGDIIVNIVLLSLHPDSFS